MQTTKKNKKRISFCLVATCKFISTMRPGYGFLTAFTNLKANEKWCDSKAPF